MIDSNRGVEVSLARTASLAWIAAAAFDARSDPLSNPLDDLPPAAHVTIVGEALRVNGMPMRIYRFTAAQSARDLQRHLRARGYVPLSAPAPTRLYARREADAFTTIVIRDTGGDGSRGEVAQVQATPVPITSPEPALPAGSSMLTRVESVDGAVRGDVFVLTNGLGIEANIGFYAERFLRRGWVRRRSSAGPIGAARVVSFDGPGGEAAVSALRGADGRTVVHVSVLERAR